MADLSSSVANKRRLCMVPENARIHMASTVLQFIYAGVHIICRTMLNMSVSMLVFSVYRNVTALLLLIPFAYFLEKYAQNYKKLLHFLVIIIHLIYASKRLTNISFLCRKDRPPLNISHVMKFFLLGLLGIEQMHLNRKYGKAKVLGTLASVAGASVITFYKGPTIYVPPSTSPLSQSHMLNSLFGDVKEENWTFGYICVISHCLCWSTWIVLQAPVLKKYPARLSVRCGVGASAMANVIQIWVIDKGGPVYVSLYLPLQTAVVAVMDSLVFGEEFYLGSIIGAMLTIAGLYLVVWGKRQESKIKVETSSMPGNINSLINYCSGGEEPSLVQALLPTSAY
ncbi:putative EamA domain-containing protein [Rosa chinensis]|uniref:Putative EamA domain-containing protein n=1 Tax=Rosa chinensis TaxID=74649 RepID=A0A2P6RM42_ROSCH|nr:putative EamA domain-containing protein [Rosa chinensis]